MPRENLEDKIIDNIESATGEDLSGNEPEDIIEDDVEVGTDDQQRQQRNDRQDDDDDQQLPLFQDPKQKKKPEQQQEKPRRDKDGNLVDKDGKVIANRGAERRLHVQAERLRTVNTDLQNRVQELTQQVAANKAFNGLPERLGIGDPQILQEGLGIVALFNKDAKAGARKVIELALARGVDLKELVDDEFVANVSTRSIETMLNDRLGPIEQQNKNQRAQEEEVRNAEMATNRFLAEYPEGEIHAEDIASIMAEDRKNALAAGRTFDPFVSAEKALLRIQNFAISNGLDPEQPIAPQIEAIKAEREKQGNTPPHGQRRPANAPQRQSRPMPRSSNVNGADVVETRQRSARPDDNFDNIVREAMQEAGYEFGR